MIIAGTIKNSVALASLESKWQQKKQDISKGSKEDLTAEERDLQRFQEQADSIRESRKPANIDAKLEAGAELTAEEIEYLKKNNPEALKEYKEIRRERENYKKQLKNCRSKEEVDKLKMTKMGQYMAEAKKITNDPHIPKGQKYKLMKKMLKKISAVEEEHEKFLQSLRYAELPEEEKEAEKKKHMDETAQKEESEDTALSDVSLSGATIDALEEIRKMTEGLRLSTKADLSESVTNRNATVGNANTAAGSIDLKI